MIRSYLIRAFRHLWRHRLFTSLNILGLAISISACWIIVRIVDYEFSYERNIPDKERIYRLISGFVWDEKESYSGGVSAPIYQAVRKEVTGLDRAVPVLGQWATEVKVNIATGKPLTFDDPSDMVATDSAYFAMAPYHWVAGNPSAALNAPNQVVLTSSRATQYFPGLKPEQIIGHTLTYFTYRDTITRAVTGIVADQTTQTEFTAKEICSLPTKPYKLNEWTNTNGSDRLYLQVRARVNPSVVLSQVDRLVAGKVKEFEQSRTDHFTFKRWFRLLPLTESHFSTFVQEYGIRKASKPVLYGLIGIGVFLLLLACINYINMSVAAMPQRAKEIGVRKTLGSSHAHLITQFLSETLLTTFLAALLANALSAYGFWMLKDIIPPGVTPLGNFLQLTAFVIVISFLLTLVAGLYPGWLITKVKTIQVFRSLPLAKASNNPFSLQRMLIVFQFTIALVFITCAFIVGNQLHYSLTTDLGFNRDAVVLVDLPWKYASDKHYDNKQFPLSDELKKIPGVSRVSLGTAPMSTNFSSGEFEYDPEGKPSVSRNVYRKVIDTNYLSFYDLKLLAGRNLHTSDTTNEFIINETAVQSFGFKSPQDAIGKFIGQKPELFPIVGVVNDFHQQDFYKKIDPLAFESEKDDLTSFNIKLATANPDQWQSTLKAIEAKWYQFYPPESFSYKFYDETIEGMYVEERHLAKLVNLATSIAIFISCLGLFGLSVLTAFQRTKEIGIRKVLGASVVSIMQLLSKEYLRLIVVAIVIASPIAWWLMTKWLESFAYRIPISWWLFGLVGLTGIFIGLITVSFQSLRAALANPVESLRAE